WDAVTGQLLHTLRGHTDPVTSATFSPDGTRILTASDDRTVRVWDARTGATLDILRDPESAVNDATYSSDGKRILVAMLDGRVVVYRACQVCLSPDQLVAEATRHLTRSLTPDERRQFLHE